jgi:hypothetical protein
MRESGPTRLIVYCGDYKCAHSVVIDASRWADHVRLSDLEPLFVCKACGHRGADVRPLFETRQRSQEPKQKRSRLDRAPVAPAHWGMRPQPVP